MPPDDLAAPEEVRTPRHLARWARIDRLQLQLAERAIARDAQARILELGSGTGRLLRQVAGGARRFGVDLDWPSLRCSQRREIGTAAPQLLRADAHRLPFADASFAVILAGNSVFDYLDGPRALAECARLLTPGGHLAVHQGSARTLTLEALIHGRENAVGKVGDPAEVDEAARAAGLQPVTLELWRSVRFWPYALRVPRRLAWRFWSHATFVFRKPG